MYLHYFLVLMTSSLFSTAIGGELSVKMSSRQKDSPHLTIARVTPLDGSSSFISVRLERGNLLTWSCEFEVAGRATVDRVILDETRGTTLLGHFHGIIDFYGQSLATAKEDRFIAIFDPEGNLLYLGSLGREVPRGGLCIFRQHRILEQNRIKLLYEPIIEDDESLELPDHMEPH